MKLIVIVLGIVVVVLSYILLRYFSDGPTKLMSVTSLKTGNTKIPVTNITSSTRYAFGVWIYINSWDTTNTKTIFSMPGKIKLYLGNMKPTLYVNINLKGKSDSQTAIPITENFPLQKWVYVTISVDNSFVDMYIDGKLIKSTKLDGIQIDAKESNVYLGGNPAILNDIIVAKFFKWTTPLSISDVWSEYNKGNGGSNAFYKALSSYGVNVNLLKDDVNTATFRLF